MAEFKSGGNLRKFVRNTEWYKDRKETERRFEGRATAYMKAGLRGDIGKIGFAEIAA